jgi:hypothetical protein
MTKSYAPAAPAVRNFVTKPDRPTKIRNAQRKPYRSAPPATDELLHRSKSQAADSGLTFARYRSRHVTISWHGWNGKPWKLEEVTKQYSDQVSRLQHAEGCLRASARASKHTAHFPDGIPRSCGGLISINRTHDTRLREQQRFSLFDRQFRVRPSSLYYNGVEKVACRYAPVNAHR